MKSHFAEFSGSYYCNRKWLTARVITQQKTHSKFPHRWSFDRLLSGQTDGAKDAVFPLSGHLIGEGGVDEIDHAKRNTSQDSA